jgi:acetyl-CoA carboxylase biotin carboxyl carrier protein
MDIEDIRQLVRLMIENDLSELDVTDGERKILLKRGASGAPVVSSFQGSGASGRGGHSSSAPAQAPAPAPSAAPPAEELIEIRSPMVGTFYAAPSPDSEPYVSEGSVVDDETVVCIIEAMKVMNEIKPECSGTIREICVKNAQPVEYGQVLFRVSGA